MAVDTGWLQGPLTPDAGIPRRVGVYERVAAAVQRGELRAGEMLPSESDLGTALGVSRTVVREALMLLEEDGLIRSRRGIGRFVTGSRPRIGLERLRPAEELLGGDRAVEVRRTETTLQAEATDFVRQHLGAGPDEPTWFCESVLTRDGVPIALTQEHVVWGERLAAFGAPVATPVREAVDGGGTVLAALAARLGRRFDAGLTSLVPGVAGESRGAVLAVAAADPVLVLTQRVTLGGSPLLVTKHLITAAAGDLTVAYPANG